MNCDNWKQTKNKEVCVVWVCMNTPSPHTTCGAPTVSQVRRQAEGHSREQEWRSPDAPGTPPPEHSLRYILLDPWALRGLCVCCFWLKKDGAFERVSHKKMLDLGSEYESHRGMQDIIENQAILFMMCDSNPSEGPGIWTECCPRSLHAP